MSTNLALQTRLVKTKSREHDAQTAREAADENLAKMSRNADEVGELRKLQAASDLCVHELTGELKTVKVRLIQTTAENLELSTKLDSVVAESDKRPERGGCSAWFP